ncbi:MAG TPA: toll/interleukin-1 receptor domain-containing protein [Bryobacteraceae bacterium]|nr:toll/interleukin-1 receptor domain-containing protein [Bryobacteraceae bacterium]
MPGVFLSHSSKDKAFVLRLAVDLAVRRIPVWLDSWEMGLGDSLSQLIFDGIDNSGFLVAIVSKNSLKSGWVDKELAAALAKEAASGQTFILPIKISTADLPASLDGRIFADFSDSYFDGFEDLLTKLKSRGADQADIPPEKRIIPLLFAQQIFLKADLIAEVLNFLPPGYVVGQQQLVVHPCSVYNKLRKALKRRLEHILDDPDYGPELESMLEFDYRKLLKLEDALKAGIVEILERGKQTHLPTGSLLRACEYYARLVRSRIYALLWGSQSPRSMVIDHRDGRWFQEPLSSDGIKGLYGIEELEYLSVGDPIREDGFPAALTNSWTVVIEANADESRMIRQHQYPTLANAYSALASATLSDYFIPQTVYKRHILGQDIPWWETERFYFGIE